MAPDGTDAVSLSDTLHREDWLVATGDMADRVRAFPWVDTPLGPMAAWPDHLRTTVSFVLEARAPMALVWGREFHFLYNDSYARIIQDKHPSALGARCAAIFPELWDILGPLFSGVFAGHALVMEDYVLQVTRRGETKPGYFSFSYTPVRHGRSEVLGFVAVVVETTARVVQEQERAQVFDTVLSAITDFAYTFDPQGRFTYVNKALLDLWGLRLEQAVGRNFFELNYPPDLAARLQSQIQQVITERMPVRDETRYVSPLGVSAYYEYIFSPVYGADGAVITVAGSTRDITARKNLELAAIAASKAKDDFLAMLSHELRTPLNPALLLASDGEKNPLLPEPVRADFKAIAESLRLEASLIDDLLDISRITHDKLTLQLQPLDLHPLLLRVIESLSGELAQKKLQLTQSFDAPRTVVMGDAVRLHQVFSNLLRNAVKFTPAERSLALVTRPHPQSSSTLLVEVIDAGIGLTPEELAVVFAPFAQGRHAEKRTGEFGGLGLGLAISRKIVELHSGSISGQSAGRDEGATFTVELPLAVATAVPFECPDDASPNTRTPGLTGLRVLLVEDHAPSRQILSRLLTNRKISVVEAASAAEALQHAATDKFDLVISDLGLPDQTGYELMAVLRQKYGVPGIALSGYGTQADIRSSQAAGFARHLTKPVQASELDRALAEACSARGGAA